MTKFRTDVFNRVLVPTSHCDITVSVSYCVFFPSALSAPSTRFTTPLCLLTAERSPQPPEDGGLTAETPSQCEVSIAGETLEDMSLSSNSSLDKNDTSQEYMDDFDNLGKTTDTSSTLRFESRPFVSNSDVSWEATGSPEHSTARTCRHSHHFNTSIPGRF